MFCCEKPTTAEIGSKSGFPPLRRGVFVEG